MSDYNDLVIAIVRGDKRHEIVCKLILQDGFEVRLIDRPIGTHSLVPLPPGSIVAIPKADEEERRIIEQQGMRIVEYGHMPEYSEPIAHITAENALLIAMSGRTSALENSNALVLGYGAIAKHLCKLLLAFGTKVCVCARSEKARDQAKSLGCTVCDFQQLIQKMQDFDLIFNTVPSVVLGKEALQNAQKSCYIIDLASKPGGVNFPVAQRLGLQTVHALGLPGKHCPHSAALAVRHAIYRQLTVISNSKEEDIL